MRESGQPSVVSFVCVESCWLLPACDVNNLNSGSGNERCAGAPGEGGAVALCYKNLTQGMI